MKTKQEKVLVIGIDSASPDILERLLKEGKLPVLNKLCNKGLYSRLESTKPPLSPLAWSSFVTGRNPENHGILDFVKRKSNSYEFVPVNSSDRRAASAWEILNRRGKRVGIYNLPLTYPPGRVNSFIVSGWLSPHHKRDFTFPKDLIDEIENNFGDYNPYPKLFYSDLYGDLFIKEMERILNLEYNCSKYLIKAKEWDLFITVFFGLDIVQHYLWHLSDKDHPLYSKKSAKKYGDYIEKYYQKIDNRIGKLLKLAGKNTTVVILSDHGSGPQYRQIYLNNWLMSQGYLVLKESSPLGAFKKLLFDAGITFSAAHKIIGKLGINRLLEARYIGTPKVFGNSLMQLLFLSFDDVDWEKTKAYSVGRYYGNIYINLSGREPQGIIKPGKEYKRLREQIKEKIKKFKDPESGELLISSVYDKEELYKGPFNSKAPDLIVIPQREEDSFFGLVNFGSNKLIEHTYRTTGSHRDEGILIISSKAAKKRKIKKARIIDVLPTILALMHEEVPSQMDGRVLDIFDRRDKPKKPKFIDFELNKKIRKSQDVIKDVFKKHDPARTAIAWTGGKDSTVILHMIRTLFEGRVPFPVLFNDSTMEFQEVYDFIEEMEGRWKLNLLRVTDEKGLKIFNGTSNWDEKRRLSRIMKINAINKALEIYKLEVFIVGIRRDEHKAREKELYFSKRKNHLRIHPILHFKEEDIWSYIKTYNVPYVSLYDKGYRSLGEAPFTRPSKTGGSERSGREYDKEIIMERLRKSGYW